MILVEPVSTPNQVRGKLFRIMLDAEMIVVIPTMRRLVSFAELFEPVNEP
jgi:hypothetical protein